LRHEASKGFDCIEEIKSAIKLAKENEKRIVSNAMYRYRKVYGAAMIPGRDKDGYPIATLLTALSGNAAYRRPQHEPGEIRGQRGRQDLAIIQIIRNTWYDDLTMSAFSSC